MEPDFLIKQLGQLAELVIAHEWDNLKDPRTGVFTLSNGSSESVAFPADATMEERLAAIKRLGAYRRLKQERKSSSED